MNAFVKVFLFVFVALSVAACAPSASPASNTRSTQQRRVIVINNPAAEDVIDIANIAWHRMQLNFLETGNYSTNVLVDLSLPQGVRWVLEDFSNRSYRIRFVSSDVPEIFWLITPEGVQTLPVG
jgi:hypothetical protein